MWIVTGANGFIGSVIVSDLNKRGLDDLIVTDSVGLDKRPHLLAGKKFRKFIHSDELFAFLKTNPKLKGVIHMGACSDTTEMNVEFLRQNNTEYTRRLFEFCHETEIPFIYASSGAVYGNGSEGFDDDRESDKFQPLNPYGWSKLNFDVWAEKQKATPPRWYGLRFFNVFGPNEDHKGEMSSVVYKAFRQINANGSLRLFRSHRPEYRDGEQLRDFIYVKDISAWIVDLMDNPRAASGIYNMGHGRARTWLDLARSVFKEMNRELKIEWIDIPTNIRDQYQYLTEAKMQKWQQEIGLKPKWNLEEGIHDYVSLYLNKARYL